MVQAVRGPLSLAAGIVAAKLGYTWLETKVGVKVWVFRAVAALMMFSAIVLYAYCRTN